MVKDHFTMIGKNSLTDNDSENLMILGSDVNQSKQKLSKFAGQVFSAIDKMGAQTEKFSDSEKDSLTKSYQNEKPMIPKRFPDLIENEISEPEIPEYQEIISNPKTTTGYRNYKNQKINLAQPTPYPTAKFFQDKNSKSVSPEKINSMNGNTFGSRPSGVNTKDFDNENKNSEDFWADRWNDEFNQLIEKLKMEFDSGEGSKDLELETVNTFDTHISPGKSHHTGAYDQNKSYSDLDGKTFETPSGLLDKKPISVNTFETTGKKIYDMNQASSNTNQLNAEKMIKADVLGSHSYEVNTLETVNTESKSQKVITPEANNAKPIVSANFVNENELNILANDANTMESSESLSISKSNHVTTIEAADIDANANANILRESNPTLNVPDDNKIETTDLQIDQKLIDNNFETPESITNEIHKQSEPSKMDLLSDKENEDSIIFEDSAKNYWVSFKDNQNTERKSLFESSVVQSSLMKNDNKNENQNGNDDKSAEVFQQALLNFPALSQNGGHFDDNKNLNSHNFDGSSGKFISQDSSNSRFPLNVNGNFIKNEDNQNFKKNDFTDKNVKVKGNAENMINTFYNINEDMQMNENHFDENYDVIKNENVNNDGEYIKNNYSKINDEDNKKENVNRNEANIRNDDFYTSINVNKYKDVNKNEENVQNNHFDENYDVIKNENDNNSGENIKSHYSKINDDDNKKENANPNEENIRNDHFYKNTNVNKYENFNKYENVNKNNYINKFDDVSKNEYVNKNVDQFGEALDFSSQSKNFNQKINSPELKDNDKALSAKKTPEKYNEPTSSIISTINQPVEAIDFNPAEDYLSFQESQDIGENPENFYGRSEFKASNKNVAIDNTNEDPENFIESQDFDTNKPKINTADVSDNKIETPGTYAKSTKKPNDDGQKLMSPRPSKNLSEEEEIFEPISDKFGSLGSFQTSEVQADTRQQAVMGAENNLKIDNMNEAAYQQKSTEYNLKDTENFNHLLEITEEDTGPVQYEDVYQISTKNTKNRDSAIKSTVNENEKISANRMNMDNARLEDNFKITPDSKVSKNIQQPGAMKSLTQPSTVIYTKNLESENIKKKIESSTIPNSLPHVENQENGMSLFY